MSRRFPAGADYNGASVNFVSSGAHSACAWARVASVGSDGLDVCYMDASSGGANSQSLWVGADSAGNWRFQEDGGTYDFSSALTLNTWTHLALTYDGTTARAYINGAVVNTTTVSLTPSRANFNWCSTGTFNGDFQSQDVFVFNATLSAEDLLRLSRTRRPAKVGGPYLWWPLHNDTPTWDASGNGHTLSSTAGSAATAFPPADWAPDNPTLLRVFLNTSGGTASGGDVRSGTSAASAAASGGDVRSGGAVASGSGAGGDIRSGAARAGAFGLGGDVRSGASAASAAASGGTVRSGTSGPGAAGSGGDVRGGFAIIGSMAIGGDVRSGQSNPSAAATGGTVRSGVSAPSATASGGSLRGGSALLGAFAAGGDVRTGAAFAGAIALGGVVRSGIAVPNGITPSGPGLGNTQDVSDRRWLGALGARRRLRR